MWDVDKMKIRWTNQAEEPQTEVFFEKGTATPENFRRLGKKRGGDCRIAVKREGCDGITFAQRMGARTVIDLATLTYSAQRALGDQVVALFGNDREALRSWEETAEQTGEYYWQLPMGPIYHRMIEWSICADFANYAPGRGAGASVAACFLENFVEEGTQWIHLDMVGPSVVRKETDEMAEGASGACMSTLAAYLTR